MLHTSVRIVAVAWHGLVPEVLVVLAVGKRREFIDIDKLDAVTERQLDEARHPELRERAADRLYGQTQKIADVGVSSVAEF